MAISLQSSLMMVLSKLALQSLRSLTSALKIEMYPCHRNLAIVFAVWLGVTYARMCFIKWSQKTKRFTTFGGWSNSIVVSMLIKSTCSNSKGVVTMMGHTGALAQLPSFWIHCSQLLITFCICMAMPGYQNQSCSKQCPLLTLVSSILVTSIYGSYSVSCGDYKLQNLFQLATWCVMMVEGSMVEC